MQVLLNIWTQSTRPHKNSHQQVKFLVLSNNQSTNPIVREKLVDNFSHGRGLVLQNIGIEVQNDVKHRRLKEKNIFQLKISLIEILLSETIL